MIPGRVLGVVAVLAFICAASPADAQRPRLPRPERLDAGVEYRRDAATGELRYFRVTRGAAAPAPAATPAARSPSREDAPPAAIRVRVSLVEVGVNVFAADGGGVRGLGAGDFRLSEDGAGQAIAHFDAASDPAAIALVIDSSPSVLRDIRRMKQAARALARHLAPQDEVAVVAFAEQTRLLLPFTADRRLLERAIDSVEVALGPGAARRSHVYEAVYLAAQELFGGRTGRKAIVLLTDGQDSSLGLGWAAETMQPRAEDPHRLAWEDLCRALAAAGVEVYAVTTQPRPRALAEPWLAARRERVLVSEEARAAGIPHYTVYLAELVRRAGGQLYFLAELRGLEDAWRRIAENLRAQYTLGFYPRAGTAQPGWRSLRVTVAGRDGLRVSHRAAYYVPAGP